VTWLFADGAALRAAATLDCDVAVVGSGPAGAAVARRLARRGADVVVLEEGPLAPEALPADAFGAMSRLYRDMGASLLLGRAPMPLVQGRAVGGTSVVNGAISWRLPRDVYDAWVADDPALAEALPWEAIDALFDEIERDLHIRPTPPETAGPKNLLMARGADALGLAHRPISRNVRDCAGLGRCLQGCPAGHKLSMDRTFLPDAAAAGARVLAGVRVDGIEARGRAEGVVATTAGGARLRVRARRAVVLAASAVQTPVLLWRSGLRHGPVGEHLQCHPGVSMSARFPEPVRMWSGATQGHEVTGLRGERIKLEVLGYDLALVAARLKGIGRALAAEIAEIDHHVQWGAALRARGCGRVRPGLGRARARFDLTREDLGTLRRAVRVLGEVMLAAGAEHVSPGVHGWHERVSDPAVMARFEAEAPWDPRAYSMAVTHLFGTCRMHGDPARGVVRPDFRHHRVEGLYVADSSVFPSNTGVNPQTSILALASLCADRIAAA
jgi:choline dehydrogenase-like flavoprotein